MAFKQVSHQQAQRNMAEADNQNAGTSRLIPRWQHESWVREVLAANDLAANDASVEMTLNRMIRNHPHDYGNENNYVLEAARQVGVTADEDMWREIFRDHPNVQQGPLRPKIIGNAFALGPQWRGAEAYKRILEEMLVDDRFTDYILPTAEAKAAQDETNHRAKLISAITENGAKSAFPVWSPVHGQVRYANASTLANEPTETLETLAQTVPQLRARIAGTADAPAPPPSPKDSLGNDARLNRGQETYEINDAALPLNPATNAPYTRRDIMQASKQELQRLLFPAGKPEIWKARQNAVNAVLDGRA
jgi:hypothetical protein